MSDVFRVEYGFPQYGNELPALSDVIVTFQLVINDKTHERLTPHEVQREGVRYFVAPLPDGSVRRYRLIGPRELEEVDSIPGGDPAGVS